MEIVVTSLASCHTATGAVVVIDVLRSFSTAAYAFAAGASVIFPVACAADALALQTDMPDALTVGAVGGGAPIPGFDFGNSPAAIAGHDFQGRRIIHCTAAGIQGLLRCQNADLLLAASMVCARATARFLRALAPAHLTLIVTGDWIDRDGDEDRACADYLIALLHEQAPDPAPFVARVRDSDFGRRFTEPDHPTHPAADLAYCMAVDRYDFAMQVKRSAGRLVIEPVREAAL